MSFEWRGGGIFGRLWYLIEIIELRIIWSSDNLNYIPRSRGLQIIRGALYRWLTLNSDFRYAKDFISKAPNNESAWNYLRGYVAYLMLCENSILKEVTCFKFILFWTGWFEFRIYKAQFTSLLSYLFYSFFFLVCT